MQDSQSTDSQSQSQISDVDCPGHAVASARKRFRLTPPKGDDAIIFLNDLRFFCRKAASFNVLYHSLSWVGKPAEDVGAFVRNGDYSLKWIATAKCAQ
jgi:hypothetical protein